MAPKMGNGRADRKRAVPRNLRFDRAVRFARLGRVLAEFKNVRQEPGKGLRRWFEDNRYELVVWYRPEGALEGFQIHYQKGRAERALTWRDGEGFTHSRVDDGSGSPLKNLAPILLPNGSIPWPDVLREFDASSAELEPDLRSFVRQHLEARR
jgi:hypothetical protein